MASSGTKVKSQPSTTYFQDFIWEQDAPLSWRKETLGKWMVFKHKTTIDETWEQIRQAVQSGELGATGAKVSTRRPSSNEKDPNMHVICVYTSREEMDEVGLKLIHLPLVRQTIRYKTDEATLAGKYACHGDGKVTCRILYWNDGNTVFKD